MKEYETLLRPAGRRVFKSHLVNLEMISRYISADGGYVLLKEGSTVPVSNRKKEILVSHSNDCNALEVCISLLWQPNLGSVVMTFLSFVLINVYQQTLHFDGLGLVFFLSMLYSFFLSIPGVGHLNLYYSRNFQSENLEVFWNQFKRRYFNTSCPRGRTASTYSSCFFGFSYPAFTLTNALTVLPWILMIVFSYGLSGWLIILALKEKLRLA